MNLVYYLQGFPKLSESFILNEIVELENRGHNILVIALNNPEEEITHQEIQDLDIDVEYLDRPSYTDITDLISQKLISSDMLSRSAFLESPRDKARDLHYAKQAIEILKRKEADYDVIHTHFLAPRLYSANYISSSQQLSWVITAHAVGMFSPSFRKKQQKMLKDSDKVITVSEYNRNYLKEEWGYDQDIGVVPVSIDTEKFAPRDLEEKNKIVSVGRLVEKKGFKYGIKAFSKIADDYPQLEYNIIGKGEKKEELENLIRAEGLEDRVNLLGHVTDERLKTELEESQLFLLPCVIAENGDRDAMPMVIKEAMSLETPCISTKISALPEIIDHEKDGMLVQPKNVDQTSKALAELLQSKEKRQKYGQKARNKIEDKFEISGNAAKIEQILANSSHTL